jgi:hypothetical protein
VETTGELLLPWHLGLPFASRCSHAAAAPRIGKGSAMMMLPKHKLEVIMENKCRRCNVIVISAFLNAIDADRAPCTRAKTVRKQGEKLVIQ